MIGFRVDTSLTFFEIFYSKYEQRAHYNDLKISDLNKLMSFSKNLVSKYEFTLKI